MAGIRSGTAAEIAAVCALLAAENLPTDGVADHIRDFLVAEEGGKIVGAVGIEYYADVALLRSAVVAPPLKGRGVGSRLVEALEQRAKAQGVRRLILLTTTAAEYFRAKGYRPIDRALVQGPITRSVEFTGACPASALCMEKVL
jgi:amino-acid N-acetyltransferase